MPQRIEAMTLDNRAALNFKPSPLLIRSLGLGLFISLGIGVEWFMGRYQLEQTAYQRTTTGLLAEKAKARLEGELNGVIITSNAIGAHWSARLLAPNPEETRQILGNAYRNGRHVRSFALATGTRITQVFPQDDDVQVTGLDYRDQPKQWPLVQRTIETHSALLTTAVPPERGIISYRMPVFINGGQFWGLLTTQIDESSLLSASGLAQIGGNYQYALQAITESGTKREMLVGEDWVFDDPKAYVVETTIPGGTLKLGVKPATTPSFEEWIGFWRGLGWLFAALFAAQSVALLKMRRMISDLALYDALTNLPSRHLFLDRLKQTIRRTKRNRGNFSVLFINLNDFKTINTRYGEKVGDMMLAGIGNRLLTSIRHCDTVTRWGGDEFLILLDACPIDEAKLIAENLRHKIELPVSYGNRELRIGAAIGLATYPENGHSLSALLKIADAAMREDKACRKA